MNKMSNRGFVSCCLSLAMLLTISLQPLAAAEQQKPRFVIDPQAVVDAVSAFQTLGGVEGDVFIELALRSKQYWGFQERLAEGFQTAFNLQARDAYAMSDGELVGVFIPIAGGYGYSSLQVMFERASGRLVSTAGYLFEKGATGGLVGTVEVDGAIRMMAEVTDAGQVLSGWVLDELGGVTDLTDIEFVQSAANWGCFTDCLNGFGIPNAILVLVGIACGAICYATLGLGCAVCIAALGIGFSYEIGVCRERCR